MVQIKSIDHIVLTVKDIDKTVDWYVQHLGMKHEVFSSPKDLSVKRYVYLHFMHEIMILVLIHVVTLSCPGNMYAL